MATYVKKTADGKFEYGIVEQIKNGKDKVIPHGVKDDFIAASNAAAQLK